MNWIFYTSEVYLIIAQCFLCGKDASSYLLFTRDPSPLQKVRTARWHRDGVFLALLFLLPCVIFSLIYGPEWYWITGAAFLIRIALYDPAFNDFAGIQVTHFGVTAWSDRLSARIFGTQGVLTKAIIFFILFIILNILKISIK